MTKETEGSRGVEEIKNRRYRGGEGMGLKAN